MHLNGFKSTKAAKIADGGNLGFLNRQSTAPVAMTDGPVDREEAVYLAKLAEQAERYDEMVRWRFLLRDRDPSTFSGEVLHLPRSCALVRSDWVRTCPSFYRTVF